MSALALDVDRAARGDREAFARLVAATKGMVAAVALAITRDVPASQDVAQEVFLAAWVGLPRLRDPASFLPWIRQITRFRARSWQRDRVDGVAPDQLVDPAPQAESALLAAEERQALAEAFERLDEDSREVITLYYREGASTAQLAALCEVSEAAIRQRLSRARGQLREELLARLGEALKNSAPGAGFVAGVLASLAAPPSAAAAGFVVAGKAGKLWPILGGAGLGLAGGLAGVFLGLRPHLRDALDEEERRRLRRFGQVAALVTVAACLGYSATHWLESAALGIVTHVGFIGAMLYLYWYRLPRLTARADAVRAASDPGHARRLRLRRTWGRLAFLVGVGLSTWSFLAAMVARGWL